MFVDVGSGASCATANFSPNSYVRGVYRYSVNATSHLCQNNSHLETLVVVRLSAKNVLGSGSPNEMTIGKLQC